MNYVLILFNLVVFIFFFLQGQVVLEESIVEFGAIPEYILRGERLWTLFTSMFMHADIMHVLGNMVYLWIFGDNIEDNLGHGKYILFYLVGGLIASFAHISSMVVATTLSPTSNIIPYIIYSLKIPAVGASGAVSAVLGAYLLLFPRARIKTLVFYFFITIISVPALYYLGFWFIYQLIMGAISLTGLSSGVAFWAHIGGFAYGAISVKGLGVKAKTQIPKTKKEERVRPIVAPWVQTPLLDIIVEPARVSVLVMLPGMEEKDVRVTVSKFELEIYAKRDGLKYHKRVSLPVPVVPQVENVVHKDGLLRFTLRRML